MACLTLCAFLLTTPEMRADVLDGPSTPMTDTDNEDLTPRLARGSTRRTSNCCAPSSRSCGTRCGESFLPMSVATYLAAAVRNAEPTGRDGHGPRVRGGVLGCTLIDEVTDGVRIRDFMTVAGTGSGDDVARSSGARAGRRRLPLRTAGAWRGSGYGVAPHRRDVRDLPPRARERCPGSLARRSVARYRSMPHRGVREHPYYGRVVRTATWTALQYWFFLCLQRLAIRVQRRERPRGRLGASDLLSRHRSRRHGPFRCGRRMLSTTITAATSDGAGTMPSSSTSSVIIPSFTPAPGRTLPTSVPVSI